MDAMLQMQQILNGLAAHGLGQQPQPQLNAARQQHEHSRAPIASMPPISAASSYGWPSPADPGAVAFGPGPPAAPVPPAGSMNKPISRGDSVASLAGSDGGPMYSRKDKSLGVLCENFLALCQRIPVQRGEALVSLDKAAKDLGVERRRVYDIVNVLECVEVVTRKQKNSYLWHGFSRMAAALDGLAAAPPPEEASPADAGGIPKGERREKSMAVLARKFLQVLLGAPGRVVSLEDTCRTLLGGGLEDEGVKTKVRRLYDIANILSSLPLIEKTHIIETRKPAFKFLGVPTGEPATARGPAGAAGIPDILRSLATYQAGASNFLDGLLSGAGAPPRANLAPKRPAPDDIYAQVVKRSCPMAGRVSPGPAPQINQYEELIRNIFHQHQHQQQELQRQQHLRQTLPVHISSEPAAHGGMGGHQLVQAAPNNVGTAWPPTTFGMAANNPSPQVVASHPDPGNLTNIAAILKAHGVLNPLGP